MMYLMRASATSAGCRVVLMNDSHYASVKNDWAALLFKRWLVSFYDSALVAGTKHRSFMRLLGMSAFRIFDGYDVVDNAQLYSNSNAVRINNVAIRGKLDLSSKYILGLGRFVNKKFNHGFVGLCHYCQNGGKL
jgi:hypothetical protein